MQGNSGCSGNSDGDARNPVPQGKVVRCGDIYCSLQNEYRHGVEEEKENKDKGED